VDKAMAVYISLGMSHLCVGAPDCHPGQKWLLTFVLIGLALLLNILLSKRKELTPHEVADRDERLLTSTVYGTMSMTTST
jgi:hypothetical protein